jgi:undecaprenyl phosphate N,N'-diacetylbacillosamine 1-phosphate transferase
MNYRKIIKPICDFIFYFIYFIILLPVFLVIFFILMVANNGQPFFFQQRPGLQGKIFNVIKFKTMNDKKDIDGKLLADDKRMTKVGSFIRKTSLDEIPQLLNVIKGDMSLIGPRPLLVEYLPLYDNIQQKRHEVKPGITGWAQVNGRNTICWEQKFEFDVWYVNNLSLALDIKIFLLTFKKVFKTEGISSQNSKTMEKFSGNQL